METETLGVGGKGTKKTEFIGLERRNSTKDVSCPKISALS